MTPSDVSCCEGECEGVTTDCFPSFIPCVLVCSGQHGGPTCLLYSPVPAASAGTHSRNFRRGSNCARWVDCEERGWQVLSSSPVATLGCCSSEARRHPICPDTGCCGRPICCARRDSTAARTKGFVSAVGKRGWVEGIARASPIVCARRVGLCRVLGLEVPSRLLFVSRMLFRGAFSS